MPTHYKDLIVLIGTWKGLRLTSTVIFIRHSLTVAFASITPIRKHSNRVFIYLLFIYLLFIYLLTLQSYKKYNND
jgi:hypothetical protein